MLKKWKKKDKKPTIMYAKQLVDLEMKLIDITLNNMQLTKNVAMLLQCSVNKQLQEKTQSVFPFVNLLDVAMANIKTPPNESLDHVQSLFELLDVCRAILYRLDSTNKNPKKSLQYKTLLSKTDTLLNDLQTEYLIRRIFTPTESDKNFTEPQIVMFIY